MCGHLFHGLVHGLFPGPVIVPNNGFPIAHHFAAIWAEYASHFINMLGSLFLVETDQNSCFAFGRVRIPVTVDF